MSSISSARQESAVAYSIAALRGPVKELLKRAILTMHAAPDRERRFLSGARSAMPEMVLSRRERWNAFGPESVAEAAKEACEVQALRAGRFVPDRQDCDRCDAVLDWLDWLRQQPNGRRDERMIRALAHGCSISMIAARAGCSRDTIERRYNAAVDAITAKFWTDAVAMVEAF